MYLNSDISQQLKVWYRYDDFRYAPPLNEYEEPVGPGRAAVRLHKFKVLKETPKGVWIRYHGDFSDKRFVLSTARKRFACPTKEEALESFLARKTRQRGIYQARLRHIDEVIVMAQQGKVDDY